LQSQSILHTNWSDFQYLFQNWIPFICTSLFYKLTGLEATILKSLTFLWDRIWFLMPFFQGMKHLILPESIPLIHTDEYITGSWEPTTIVLKGGTMWLTQ
jgi:hypothetical protein